MKEEILEILIQVKSSTLSLKDAQNILLNLFSVIGSGGDMIEDNRTRCPECKSPNVDLPLKVTNWTRTCKCKCQDCGNEFDDY